MLTLSVEKLHQLYDNWEDVILTWNRSTEFVSGMWGDFMSCLGNYDSIQANILNQVGEGLISKLDMRLDNFDKNAQELYNNILGHNALFSGILFILRKYLGKENYFLQITQDYRERIADNTICIRNDEFDTFVFVTEKTGLIDTNVLTKYVSSMTNSTISNIRSFMTSDGQQSDEKVYDITSIAKYGQLVFPNQSKVDSLFNCGFNDALSYGILRQALIDDIREIESGNDTHGYYYREFVQPYITMYVSTIDEVIMYGKAPATLWLLIKLTDFVYDKCPTRLNSIILKWLLMVIRTTTFMDTLSKVNKINLKYLVDGLWKRYGCDDATERLKKSGQSETSSIMMIMTMYERTKKNIELNEKSFGLVFDAMSNCYVSNSPNADNVGGLVENSNVHLSESIRIEQSGYQMIKALTEGFKVLKDGSIQVVLKRKTTYMNEYAVNHRLLKYNSQQKDYEGMKYNLVYALMLVESIEQNVIHNPEMDNNSAEYKDAEKARMFALNDISTYLPEVKSKDRKFDLNKFYKEVHADMNTISIDVPSAVSGVKKIVSAVLH